MKYLIAILFSLFTLTIGCQMEEDSIWYDEPSDTVSMDSDSDFIVEITEEPTIEEDTRVEWKPVDSNPREIENHKTCEWDMNVFSTRQKRDDILTSVEVWRNGRYVSPGILFKSDTVIMIDGYTFRAEHKIKLYLDGQEITKEVLDIKHLHGLSWLTIEPLEGIKTVEVAPSTGCHSMISFYCNDFALYQYGDISEPFDGVAFDSQWRIVGIMDDNQLFKEFL